jgi:hypothetical protein
MYATICSSLALAALLLLLERGCGCRGAGGGGATPRATAAPARCARLLARRLEGSVRVARVERWPTLRARCGRVGLVLLDALTVRRFGDAHGLR